MKSRKVMEITWLTKGMVLMANVSTVFFCLWSILYQFGADTLPLVYISPAVRITDIVNFGLMFRFVRLQVQLKASQENSKIIMGAIQRSKQTELIVLAVLLINILAMLLQYIADFAMAPTAATTETSVQADNLQGITYMIFSVVFCYHLEKVN